MSDRIKNDEKSRIWLVTGAAGFLGSNVCRQLKEKGEQVRALVLENDPSAQFLPEGVEVVYGDLLDREALEKFFEVPGDREVVVLHIASIVTVNPEFSKKVMDVNVRGTENIIALCKEHLVSRLVYCSSTGAIPESRGVIRECDDLLPIDPDRVRGCYSLSKALATNLVLMAAKEGLPACVVHPSGIMGPMDYAMGETTKTLMDIINGKMPAGIAGSFNLCDVRDLAAGLIAAAFRGKDGECYILGNEPVSFKDFAGLVAQESGCKPMKTFLPLGMAGMLAKFMEKNAKKKGKKPLLTTFSVYNLARNNNFDSGKARRELGYSTRSYRETIRDEVRWLKEMQYIV